MSAINEKEEAIRTANRILNRIGGNPDDELTVLARQFLRALERLGEYADPLKLLLEKRVTERMTESPGSTKSVS